MITDRIGIHSVLLPFYTQYLVVPTRKAILYSKSAYLICDSPWERQSFVPLQKSRQITVLMYEQRRKSRRIQIAFFLLSPSDFLFRLLNFDTVFKNSTPEKFTNIWRIERDGKRTITFEAAQHSFCKWLFSQPPPSLLLKLPNKKLQRLYATATSYWVWMSLSPCETVEFPYVICVPLSWQSICKENLQGPCNSLSTPQFWGSCYNSKNGVKILGTGWPLFGGYFNS